MIYSIRYCSMDVIEFAKKAWYMENGFINKPLPEITKLWKENIKNQKKYFIIKDKIKKDQRISDTEQLFYSLKKDNIIW